MSLAGKTVLVTGGSGFVGRHLLAALADAGCRALHGTALEPECPAPGTTVHWHPLDITDRTATLELLSRLAPDVVFHLAAQSHVPTSFAHPATTWSVNLQGTLNLLEATAAANPRAVFVNAGSADIYGASFRDGHSATESTPLLPLNPYAASKAAADLAAFQFAATSSLRVIRARPFNHSGPGQGEQFVLPAFAAQVARIEAGLQAPVLRVGDLGAERDFLHIADVVDAYVRLASGADAIPAGSAFNIASGRALSIASLLELMLAASDRDIRVERDPDRLRPVDIGRVCGDSTALRAATGWRPMIPPEQLVTDLLRAWRARVAGEPVS